MHIHDLTTRTIVIDEFKSGERKGGTPWATITITSATQTPVIHIGSVPYTRQDLDRQIELLKKVQEVLNSLN